MLSFKRFSATIWDMSGLPPAEPVPPARVENNDILCVFPTNETRHTHTHDNGLTTSVTSRRDISRYPYRTERTGVKEGQRAGQSTVAYPASRAAVALRLCCVACSKSIACQI